jgi:hypothetical protein
VGVPLVLFCDRSFNKSSSTSYHNIHLFHTIRLRLSDQFSAILDIAVIVRSTDRRAFGVWLPLVVVTKLCVFVLTPGLLLVIVSMKTSESLPEVEQRAVFVQ